MQAKSPLLPRLLLFGAAAILCASASAQSFVNWESPQVHPVDMTPDGRLLAVNTADNRLLVYGVSGTSLTLLATVPVGLDPVSVRAQNDGRAWVVNHISDSVSVVDLVTGNVIATLDTADEPADVVFGAPTGGMPTRAFVSCSQANRIQVFDVATLQLTHTLPIDAEDPRALAVSPDGNTVYAAVFESGNGSTVLGGGSALAAGGGFPPNVVDDPTGPYGGQNPPPNAPGEPTGFIPAKTPGNPDLAVSLIVKKNATGQWVDDQGTDWSAWIKGDAGGGLSASGRVTGWDLPDRDVAILDATAPAVTGYVPRLMNINMALGVKPDGEVTVVGTDAINEVRFEANLQGSFLSVNLARIPTAGNPSVVDLNPHLAGIAPPLPSFDDTQRAQAIGDPRGVVWSADGQTGYVTGMGSNNVIVIDGNGGRDPATSTIAVGEGPTGLVLSPNGQHLYVLNKFSGSISIIDVGTRQVTEVPFFDPTPAAIRTGRKHLYDTHDGSGLGQVSCASCHVDSRMDRLGWDLGAPDGFLDPRGADPTARNLGMGIPTLEPSTALVPFQPFHPMKGPMTTQTLQDIIGKEPLHWRGDRDGLEEFAGAFVGLQGRAQAPSAQDMQEFEDFLATIHFPPNPFRDRTTNTLPTSVDLTGHFNESGAPLATR